MNLLSETTLVLGAHGSEAAPNSNDPVFDLVKQIESTGTFAEVRPAFLMGQPNMTNVVDGVTTKRVVVVPLMTSNGYYLNKVIPGKLAQNSNATELDWYISSVAGMHPRIADLMIQHVENRIEEFKLNRERTTLMLVGHGTRRNRNSGKSTFALFDILKARFPELRTRVAFLDQDPELGLVAASILEGDTLVLPFLVSRGPHTTEDLPEAFGLPIGPKIEFPIVHEQNVRGVKRTTVCEVPLALYSGMADICIGIASQAVQEKSHLTLPLEVTA